ncbi:MAG: UDP-N-acetylglucosamine 2-epimerase (non-hydrolyzing), partial [Bacteroidetes bacterium HGW-Bacteroidetes-21]
MKIVTVIGARPQIIKSAAISRAISTHFSDQIQELTVHTGQHYDDSMSEVFFRQMSIPKPAYNLGIGSGSHGAQTAAMMKGIEDILLKEKPEAVIVYGDTNSTLAAAVASVKLHIPVVHIEAGLRSFNKSMPE